MLIGESIVEQAMYLRNNLRLQQSPVATNEDQTAAAETSLNGAVKLTCGMPVHFYSGLSASAGNSTAERVLCCLEIDTLQTVRFTCPSSSVRAVR